MFGTGILFFLNLILATLRELMTFVLLFYTLSCPTDHSKCTYSTLHIHLVESPVLLDKKYLPGMLPK